MNDWPVEDEGAVMKDMVGLAQGQMTGDEVLDLTHVPGLRNVGSKVLEFGYLRNFLRLVHDLEMKAQGNEDSVREPRRLNVVGF